MRILINVCVLFFLLPLMASAQSSNGRVPNPNSLAGRTILESEPMLEVAKENGKVVVAICVNKEGKVVEAKYKAHGSTSDHPQLIRIAIANARKYRFDRGMLDRQCGSVTYDFKFAKE
ncbi:MAG: hypothetical protein AAGG75_22045 [Bacteroidota bacterium]